MNLREIFRTALRSLRINPMRAILSILGVIFGIASVIALIAMGQGVRNQITEEIQNLGTNLLVVRSGEPVSETEGISTSQIQMLSQPNLGSSTITVQDLEDARNAQHIDDAYPMIQMVYDIEAGGQGGELKQTRTFVKGTDAHYIEMNKVEVAHGRFLQAKEGGADSQQKGGEAGECVLGTLVSSTLFGSTGEDVLGRAVNIKYVDPSAVDPTDPGSSPDKSKEFKVVGMMEERRKTVFDNPNLELYIPVEDAQSLAGGFDDLVLEIDAAVDSEDNIDAAKSALESAILENHAGEHDFNIQDQEDLMNTYQYIFDVLTALIFGVAAISLITGGGGGGQHHVRFG